MEIREEDRVLFMKYALPCAGTLVKRHGMSQEEVDALIRIVKENGKIPENAEKHFKVAFAACSLIAIDGGKQEIGEETIREYYLFQHDRMIDRRYEEMGDFDPQSCRIRPGIVVSAGGRAVVENSLGRCKYRTDYCAVAPGDIVVTHWDFVVEKIDALTAERMKTQKISLKVL